ncbi:MAG TPA: hypothetical protein VFU43_01615 [Streptosporangiaceae bacterium]|nr:hypothetical protein [Streptosporangiaceae bacterium]
MTTIEPAHGNREQLLAAAEELQIMTELIEKYPAEAQLIMAALEDGLRLGPMRVDLAAMCDG